MIEFKSKNDIFNIIDNYHLNKNEIIIAEETALFIYGICKVNKIILYVSREYQKYLNDIEKKFIENVLIKVKETDYIVIDEYKIQSINSIKKDIKDKELIDKIDSFLEKQKYEEINALTLAYLGDSVYELYVREYLIKQKIVKVNNLQKEAIKYVSAKNQYLILKKISSYLNYNEEEIVKKGRNMKSHKAPKNTDIITYKYATGFETLIGYLYLSDKSRLEEIMKIIFN